jgi:steroid delta-isomerase-like uncharacterized protein
VAGLFGCQTAGDTEVNTVNEAEVLFAEYIEAWNNHDVEQVASFFTDDCRYDNLARGQAYRGKEELSGWVKTTFDAIPDFTLEITSLFASGDMLASEWVMTGTLSGDSPALPATGESFSVAGATVAHIRDGKIDRNADYWDLATFLRQVGLME